MDPVVVVGAGPTGLALGMELSRFGVPVRLVDRRAERHPASRALAVQSRTLELLDARGPGAALSDAGHTVPQAVLYGPHGPLGRLEFGSVRSSHPSMLLVPQSETERLLEQQVIAQGAAVERGVELLAFADGGQDDAHVRVVLRHPDGGLEVVRASWLVATDGAHSTVRHTLGVPFTGRWSPTRYSIGDLAADTELPDDQMSLFLGSGFAAVFPLGGGRLRFVGTQPHDGDQRGDPDLAELQGLYDAASVVPARFTDLAWSSRFTVHTRVVPRLRVGRVFLGGDAAHVHSPAGGQGLNLGVQDMVNLGWKLALVLRGDAAPELLDTYDAERLPVVRGVVRATERATRVVTSTSAIVHRVVTTAATVALDLDQVQQVGSSLLSETRVHYRSSPLSIARATVAGLRGGDRVPTVAVDGRAAPSALLDPSRCTLIVVGDATVPFTAPWQHLVQVTRLDAGAGERGLLLVRPDGYVAFSGDAASGSMLLAWLRRWLPLRAA